ncbi:hypothetical protein E2C01_024547 [Portunus trituberculatus]|uniref:Uncharacterized protein n=1 Tax=Portunus trituberculatus TaxID=210409 RepID=A0A5B7EAV6_PORTR|nr:hypothetical protein [Portunus trituberculatus]
MKGFEDFPPTSFFKLSDNNLRGHSLKLAKPDHSRDFLAEAVRPTMSGTDDTTSSLKNIRYTAAALMLPIAMHS